MTTPTTAGARARLAEHVDRLEAAYETARQQLATQAVHDPYASPAAPEEMRDSNGRYLLLDALTALVNARTALTRADEQQQRDHWRAAVNRVAALAHDMRTWCSPGGVALTYADRIAEERMAGKPARSATSAWSTWARI